jgi:predicted acylesterase/phospholipase RssA
MAPCRIQVTFQGGGAKLCDLIAAAAAIQELERDKIVEVTRVAGTSAGAITACWYATGKPFSFIRQRLLDRGQHILARVMPQRTVSGALYRVLRGKPIYSEREFREVLWEWFEIEGQRFQKFGDFRIPVIVTAVDVLNGSKRIFEGANEIVVDALTHSAGLPFVFRTAKSSSALVDGGICENLPADELLRGEAEFGKVVGISFARQQVPQMPANPLKYGLALLDTAMGNSMDRACERIGSGYVFRISTDITTFDFPKALTDGLGNDHFGRVQSDVRTWAKKLAEEILKPPPPEEDTKAFVPPPNQEMSAHELMKRVHDIYVRAHHDTRLIIKRSSLVVTAHGLLPKSDARSSLKDGIKQIILLQPVDKPVGCFRIGMLSTGEDLVQGTLAFSIRNAQKQKVDVTLIPVSAPADTAESPLGQKRHLLFFFHPALDPQDAPAHPYVLTVQDEVPSALDGVATEKGDHVSLTSDRSEIIEVADLVVFLPRFYSNVILFDHRLPPEKAIPGRKMTDEELADYGDPPPGFVAFGWRGQNLKVGQTIGVGIRVP